MKFTKILKIQIFFILFTSMIFSQDQNIISSKTAYLLPPKSVEIGLFQPLRFGLNNNLEISFHPISMFVSPNLQIKKSYSTFLNFNFASQHTVFYPTPLLKMISREGTGGIIAEEFKDDIPHMFSFYNGILLSKQICRQYYITFKTGIKISLNSNDLDTRTSIDLPLIYPRLQPFYDGYGLQYGINITGNIIKKLYVDSNLELFHFPDSDENYAVEYNNLFIWQKSQKFQVSAGFKLIYGQYPFGSQLHLLPMFDMKWKIR